MTSEQLFFNSFCPLYILDFLCLATYGCCHPSLFFRANCVHDLNLVSLALYVCNCVNNQITIFISKRLIVDISSMASKLIKICWIRTGSKPY